MNVVKTLLFATVLLGTAFTTATLAVVGCNEIAKDKFGKPLVEGL